MNPAQAHFAETPREMALRGDWVTPRLNGARYLDKPPLAYWLGRAVYAVAGVSEGSARLVSALPMLGQVALVGVMGARHLGAAAGWAGAVVLATLLSSFLYARDLLSDPLFAFCETLALAGLLGLLAPERPRRGAWLVAGLGLAGALLTKSLVGLVLPGLSVAGFLLWTRRRIPWRGLVAAGALALLLAAPWHVAVSLQHEGFWAGHLWNEQVLRFLDRRTPRDYTSFPLWGFLLAAALGALPWLGLLLRSAGGVLREGGAGEAGAARRLLLCQALAVLGFFALTSARHVHYALPAYAPLALLAGDALVRAGAGGPGAGRGPLGSAGAWTLALPAALFALAAAAVPWVIPWLADSGMGSFAELAAPAAPLLAAAAVLAAAGALCLRHRRVTLALLAGAASALPVFVLIGEGLSAVADERSSRAHGRALARELGPGDLLALQLPPDLELENVAGLAFYTGHKAWIVHPPEAPRPYLPPPPEEDFVLEEEAFVRAWRSPQRVFVVGREPWLARLGLEPLCHGPRRGGLRLASNRAGPATPWRSRAGCPGGVPEPGGR